MEKHVLEKFGKNVVEKVTKNVLENVKNFGTLESKVKPNMGPLSPTTLKSLALVET